MTDFINEAIQEKIQRDILTPRMMPKVIVVGRDEKHPKVS